MSLALVSGPDDEEARTLEASALNLMAACSERYVSLLRTEEAPSLHWLQTYPVNTLRNLAWSRARTSHIFVMDVDFWPSLDAHELISETLRSREWARTALVVPAFQLVSKVRKLRPRPSNRKKKPTRRRLSPEEPRDVSSVATGNATRRVHTRSTLSWYIPKTRDGMMHCLVNGLPKSKRRRDLYPLKENRWEVARRIRRKVSNGTEEDSWISESQLSSRVSRAPRPERHLTRNVLHPRDIVTEWDENLYCAAFHHHGSTRFGPWLQNGIGPGGEWERALKIGCFLGNDFEPFVVVRRCEDAARTRDGASFAPRFDEAFHGYGKNKLQWIAKLRGHNYSFVATYEAHVMHMPHASSEAKMTWGDVSKKSHKKNMDRLFADQLAADGLYDETLSLRNEDLARAQRPRFQLALSQDTSRLIASLVIGRLEGRPAQHALLRRQQSHQECLGRPPPRGL